MSDSIRCDICAMTFSVSAPPRVFRDTITRCATPNCGRRYWHARPNVRDAKVRVGVWPNDPEAQIAPLPPLDLGSLGRDENFP